MRDPFILGKKIKIDRSSWKTKPKATPVPTPTPTPSLVPVDIASRLFSFKINSEIKFNASQEISFQRNHFQDSLFFNNLVESKTPLKTMIVSVDGLFKSSIQFTEARLGTTFGYKNENNTNSELLTGNFLEGIVELSRNNNSANTTIVNQTSYIQQTPVDTILIESNNQTVNINSQRQYYFFIDKAQVSRFNLIIDGIDGITLINNFSESNSNDCNFSLATTNNFQLQENKVILSSKVVLSSTNDNNLSLYYLSKEPLVLGCSPNNLNLSYNPETIIIPLPALRVETLSQQKATDISTSIFITNATPTPTITPTPTEVFEIQTTWNDDQTWTDGKVWKDISAIELKQLK